MFENLNSELKKKYKISVIIPTYNRINHGLKECLASIKNQTFQPFEILVIDDGSSDGTKEYFKDNLTKSTKYIFTNHYGDPGKARNIGIKIAKGNWIAFCDSDDIWLENKLMEQIKIIESHKSKIVCSNAKLSHNQIYFKKMPSLITFKDLFYENKVITSTILIYKDLLMSYKFPEGELYFKVEDYFLWLNLAKKNNIYFINLPLIFYSQKGDRLSQKRDYFYDLIKRTAFKYKYSYSNSLIKFNELAYYFLYDFLFKIKKLMRKKLNKI